MNRRFILGFSFTAAFLAFGLFIANHWTVRGEDAVANPRRAEVAVIDIAKTLQEYKKLEQERQKLADEVEPRQKPILEQNAEANAREAQLTERRKNRSISGDELVKLEREIQTAKLKLMSQRQALETEARSKERKLQLAAYADVQAEVERYSREHGIRLVLRIGAAPAANYGLSAPLREFAVNREVVFQDNIDITAAIVERLNARMQSP